MMRIWRRFRTLSAADRWAIADAAMLLTAVRLGLTVLPFPVVRKTLAGRAPSGPCDPTTSLRHARRVAWAVGAAGRHLPFRTNCLIDALAGEAMLHRRGARCVLRLGVRSAGQTALDAHAWLECEGVVVLGQVDGLADYAVLAKGGAA